MMSDYTAQSAELKQIAMLVSRCVNSRFIDNIARLHAEGNSKMMLQSGQPIVG